MCKNEDEVKELKYELERYRKKVGDQEKRIAELTARCEATGRPIWRPTPYRRRWP